MSSDGNDLESFLFQEVGTGAADEADEFADIEWCDLGDDSAQEVPSTVEVREQVAVERKEVKAKAKARAKDWKLLRSQSVLQFKVLVLCFLSRLKWLNGMCNDELLQAALLSRVANCEEVKLSLRQLKAHIPNSQTSQAPLSVSRLLTALRGATSSEQILMLISRWRAEARPARLVLALPLPAAKACGGLLKGESMAEIACWAEIFDPTVQRWRALGVPSQTGHWIVAMGAEGDVWDVTGRYGKCSNVLEARGSLSTVWAQLLRGRVEVSELEESANLLDQKWLLQLSQTEPLPSSRTHFKFHKVYILDSQVRSDQMVNPEKKPVGLFQGKEPIWRREDLWDLRSATKWRQEGRAVCPEERPMKVLRRDSIYSSQLYGRWQTEALPEAPAVEVGGAIPGVNNYGNIEVKHGLPKGTVHVADEAARVAAAKLGLDFAPAVVDFRRERGMLKPVCLGCVVWARDEAELRQAAEDERERLEEMQRLKRQERLRGAWQLLVKKVLLDIYVESRYADEG